MFKFSLFSKKEKIGKEIEKDKEVIKQDIKEVKDAVKKDIKKLESNESFDIFITYGWAIAVIVIGIIGFIWWQYFNIDKEKCDFLEGSDFLCENFDVTNSLLSVEIRNLNNKTVTINDIKMSSCFITSKEKIVSNDRRIFKIPCNVSSGNFKEKLVVDYAIDDFEKHTVAKLSKIIP